MSPRPNREIARRSRRRASCGWNAVLDVDGLEGQLESLGRLDLEKFHLELQRGVARDGRRGSDSAIGQLRRDGKQC